MLLRCHLVFGRRPRAIEPENKWLKGLNQLFLGEARLHSQRRLRSQYKTPPQ
jgi:hypothetical protein